MKNYGNKVKPDSVLKDYWRNNSRFADLFNQVFFHGDTLIDEGKLSDRDTDYSITIKERDDTIQSISRARDVIKQYEDGIDFVLIGLENQMHIHHAMPVRAMLYEALDYTKQCKELEQYHRKNKDLNRSDEFLSGLTKKDKLKATMTLVVYYGEKPWDGSLSLSDMISIPPAFQPYFNDYSIHLIQVCNAANYSFQNQDNYDFFTLAKGFYGSNGKIDMDEFKFKYANLEVHWETMAALGAATGSTELIKFAFKNEGGRVHMCTALENLKQEGRQEGRQEGIQIGQIEGMINAYRDMGVLDDVILLKLKSKFHFDDNEARAYLK